jgi:hypothetical protein
VHFFEGLEDVYETDVLVLVLVSFVPWWDLSAQNFCHFVKSVIISGRPSYWSLVGVGDMPGVFGKKPAKL